VNRRRETHRHRFENCSSFRERAVHQRHIVGSEGIEQNDRYGSFLGEHVDPRFCWMDSLAKRIEVEFAVELHDQFAIDDTAIGQ